MPKNQDVQDILDLLDAGDIEAAEALMVGRDMSGEDRQAVAFHLAAAKAAPKPKSK